MKILAVIGIVILAALAAVLFVRSFVSDRRAYRFWFQRQQVADEMERWARGDASESSWGAILDGPFPDPVFESFRNRLIALRQKFPPTDPDAWCSQAGWPAIRQLAIELRAV